MRMLVEVGLVGRILNKEAHERSEGFIKETKSGARRHKL